ncbi:DUF1501 domain-containing protein [Marinicellulosiphila megalodicopiae]|uniref:DUF1501 domain-containing protein n=1 Tax=Marinicellulosiphila megalodicopiae TaxID=2724896 RepID=UPI003BAE338B
MITKIMKKSTKQALNRRQFLSGSMKGAASLSLKSLATGLPIGFILGGHMPAMAAEGDSKSLILGMSDDGQPLNVYAPGSISSDSTDPCFVIERADEAGLGVASLGNINGNDIFASDFFTPSTISMGEQSVVAPNIWSNVSQTLLDRMQFFNLRTGANGHAEAQRVRNVNGTLYGADGRGSEQIQSAIMQELALQNASLNSVLTTPLILSGEGGRLLTLSQEGVPINRYTPLDIKSLFLDEAAAEIEQMNQVYDETLDQVYNNIKQNGTAAQKKYLDTYLSSRVQASLLGDRLGDLLSDINGETKNDQARAAVALVESNLSPVIVIRYEYGGDNHGDETSSIETSQTIEQINNLESMWSLIQTMGLEDKVNYATYDIFGRTLGKNSRGGRDHHNQACVNMMFGSNIQPGVMGAVETWVNSGARLLRASSINSTTGQSVDTDIDANDTLTAYARTLMASVGVSEERIDLRFSSAKTVYGALKS